MPIRKAFYVEDFGEVLSSMADNFTAADFFKGVVATMPKKGPGGEDTTTPEFRDTIKKSISNWLGRKKQMGMLRRGEKHGMQFTWHKKPLAPGVPKTRKKPGPKPRQKNKPATDSKPLVVKKTATKAPEAPQDGLTVLDIGKGIEALLTELREQKDTWMKKYHDLLREHEDLGAEMRDLKTDKENLNRQLDKQNSEILRLGNQARTGGKSSVKLGEVARFKTKNRGAAYDA